MAQKFAVARPAAKVQRRSTTALQAVGAMEFAQIAGEGGFIGGVAGVMVGITLVVSSGAACATGCTLYTLRAGPDLTAPRLPPTSCRASHSASSCFAWSPWQRRGRSEHPHIMHRVRS